MRLNGLRILSSKADFVVASKLGRRFSYPSCSILVVDVALLPSYVNARFVQGDIPFGLIVSKKVGNAVVRNKIKRRLRNIAADVVVKLGSVHECYVLIGKRKTYTSKFLTLQNDFLQCMSRRHMVADIADR